MDAVKGFSKWIGANICNSLHMDSTGNSREKICFTTASQPCDYVDMATMCCTNNIRLILPLSQRKMLPFYSTICDIEIIPLRMMHYTYTRDTHMEILPLHPDITILEDSSKAQITLQHIIASSFISSLSELTADISCVSGEIRVEGKLVAAAVAGHEYFYVYRWCDLFTDKDKLVGMITAVIASWRARFPNTSERLLTVLCSGEELINDALNMCNFLPHPACQLIDNPDGLFDCIRFSKLIPMPSLSLPRESDGDYPDAIFLLMGQSNMAGRGEVSELQDFSGCIQSIQERVRALHHGWEERGHPPFVKSLETHASSIFLDVPYKSRVFTFNPMSLKWSTLDNVMELHRSVDILKSPGLGPGPSFACRYLDINGNTCRVGLIPAAVGATSAEEWMPYYCPTYSTGCPVVDGDSCIHPPAYIYHKGCVNLFSCALRSLHQALLQLVLQRRQIFSRPSMEEKCTTLRNMVKGVLWYQGCNDALDVNNAEIFGDRFVEFVDFVRESVDITVRAVLKQLFSPMSTLSLDSGIPTIGPLIPIVNVAITSTRPWLTEISTVRRHQLNACCRVEALRTVDALGSILKGDCIHLAAPAAVLIGYLMADALCEAANCTSVQVTDENGIRRVCDMMNAKERKCLDVYLDARKQAEFEMDERYNAAQATPKEGRKVFPILRTGLKPVNFVYGEVSFEGAAMILHEISFRRAIHASSNELSLPLKFVDLGCGAGNAMAAAALTGGFGVVMGIDLMRSKLETCSLLLGHIRERARIDTPDALVKIWPEISVIEGNFVEDIENWIDSDVVFICSTCFAIDQMTILYDKFKQLKHGSTVVLLDKRITDTICEDGELVASLKPTQDVEHRTMEMIFSCQIHGSWGTACAYIYQRI